MGGVQSKNYLQLSDVSAYVDAVVTTTLFIFLAVAYSPLNIFTPSAD